MPLTHCARRRLRDTPVLLIKMHFTNYTTEGGKGRRTVAATSPFHLIVIGCFRERLARSRAHQRRHRHVAFSHKFPTRVFNHASNAPRRKRNVDKCNRAVRQIHFPADERGHRSWPSRATLDDEINADCNVHRITRVSHNATHRGACGTAHGCCALP